MSFVSIILDLFIHLDKNLEIIMQNYGVLVYPLLFLIVFLETGIVVTPFLPGDSLIFAAATISAKGFLNIYLLFIIISLAAIIGDALNYFIGKTIGREIVKRKYIKEEYINKTQTFYEKYGGKTIVLARFIPIVRTFAPFVAGIGKMKYSKFFFYNVIGAVLWVALFLILGFYFGSIPFVKNNFSFVILAIIFISIIPLFIEYFKHKKRKLNRTNIIKHF